MMRHPITGCRADSLMGLWLMEPSHFENMYAVAIKVDLVKLTEEHKLKMAAEEKKEKTKEAPYELVDGTAVIKITGPTTKYDTSFGDMFGGTSTVRTQSRLRHALRNSDVKNVMLHISSPGGTVDGAFDLAEEIAKVNRIKPVIGHGDDHLTSAAMLFGSQCRYLTANSNAQVGCIGVKSGIYDSSKKFAKKGLKAISFKTGKFKGGMEGEEISKEEIEDMQRRVDEVDDLFVDKVHIGRNIPKEQIKGLEARTYIANKAKDLGLIDKVCTFEETMSSLKNGKIPATRGPGNSQTKLAASRSTAMALTAKQLKKARGLPGAADISEDDAAEVLLESAEQLQQELNDLKEDQETLTKRLKEFEGKAPAGLSEAELAGMHRIADKEVDLLLKEGKILPTQVTAFKECLMVDKKPNPVLFAKMANGQMAYEPMIKVLEMNKPNGVLTKISGDQPQPRQEPGEEKEEEKDSDKAIKQADDYANKRFAFPETGGNGRKSK